MNLRIDLTDPGWSQTEVAVLRRLVKADGVVRGSKPPIQGVNANDERYNRWAAYVWRWLVFFASERPKDQCMPVMCYYDLMGSQDQVNAQAKALDELVDRLVAQIPVDQLPGLRNWARVLS